MRVENSSLRRLKFLPETRLKIQFRNSISVREPALCTLQKSYVRATHLSFNALYNCLNMCVVDIPVANLPPVSTTLAKLVAKFAAGVVDTGGAP
jgi:hypothetical protein